jgi:hypothetical protein
LRAFTAADRKTIRQTSQNYPETDFYKTEDLITQLGIGEALITMLNEKGVPTPLVHCMIAPPQSRMDILTDAEIGGIVSSSKIAGKYNEVVDSKSAYEILNEKLDTAGKLAGEQKEEKQEKQADKKTTKPAAKEKGVWDDPVVKSMARTAGNTIVRSLLGVLGLGGRSRKSIF